MNEFKLVEVRVVPNSNMEGIQREETRDSPRKFKFHVKAPPDHGKVNGAVLKVLAKQLRVTKDNLRIV